MKKQTYLTAIGTLRKKSDELGQTYPVIVVNDSEYAMDIQEMIIWSALCWRILDYEQLQTKYDALKGNHFPLRTFDSCVERLKTRGLIAAGSGETDFDALYDLLSELYIVPVPRNLPLRFLSFLKLILCRQAPYSKAKELFRKDHPNDVEARVIALSRQATLSVAELIQCVESDVTDISTDDKLLDAIYGDNNTTCDNIRYLAQDAVNKVPVTIAIANLYLRKQIILDLL